MKNLQIYNREFLNQFIKTRVGETKFGEKVKTLQNQEFNKEELQNNKANFVLLGLAEDIGIKANLGVPGAKNTFETFLPTLLNTQHNSFNKGSKMLVLGCLTFDELQEKASQLDVSQKEDLIKLRKIVAEIDKEVSYWVRLIRECGKTPIVVGGGHNNAYGIIKGCALAAKKSINGINIDAHTDYRDLEGRHSGNGFSYAAEEGFLNRYHVFGLHENYTSKTLFETFKKEAEKLKYTSFEALFIRDENSVMYEFDRALGFVKNDLFGLEVDCDSIENIDASAMTPCGFSTTEIRRCVHLAAQCKNNIYLHICEAKAIEDNPISQTRTSKLITYLITDYMRSKRMKL